MTTPPMAIRAPTWMSLLIVIVIIDIPAIAIADNLIIVVKTCKMKLEGKRLK